MKQLEQRNQMIIDAIIQKAQRLCPGSLALIGLYGSFATGKAHEKSDLDLLVLINDPQGFQLGRAFIQDDLMVGHDIYCTTWDSLEQDAEYTHPNISKLMDSKIVYCADPAYRKRLDALRQKVRNILESPLSKADFQKAEQLLREAEHCYGAALAAEELSEVRMQSGGTIYYLENALAMLNKTYFHLGTRHTCRELERLPLRPAGFTELIEAVLSAETRQDILAHLTRLLEETVRTFRKAECSLPVSQAAATAGNLCGTYEEMFSNWRCKLHTAALSGDRYLAFMSLVSMQAMLENIHSDVDIGHYDALSCYDPKDLAGTAAAFDHLLDRYLTEYEKAGISANRYPDIDTFLVDYLT